MPPRLRRYRGAELGAARRGRRRRGRRRTGSPRLSALRAADVRGRFRTDGIGARAGTGVVLEQRRGIDRRRRAAAGALVAEAEGGEQLAFAIGEQIGAAGLVGIITRWPPANRPRRPSEIGFDKSTGEIVER
jgi:hypothetical protein